ncbi:clionin-like peptide [Plakobranchus ocellatus]|uniref:Clionin-like peptide n=1 Tax=Plakobranchus ocellatus TaxID=259542 RepID=A0AAV4C7S1_9GAST|nr:clionin-like peptide [Plakobranchus ocellatus]
MASPQQGDLKLSCVLSGQGAACGARTPRQRDPADLRETLHLAMTPTCYNFACILAVLVCLSPLSRASPLESIEGPVEPVISLSQMAPDHACLFICTLCFPELKDTQHLMDCSNKVCGPVSEGRCAMEKFIWLGHHCKGYQIVESMWSASGMH